MRLVAVLASLAVAAAASSLPAAMASATGDDRPQIARDGDGGGAHDAATPGDAQPAPEEDDDLDERLDDLDELVAVVAVGGRAFLPGTDARPWPMHDARCPRAPHFEDTLRPPIAD